MTEARLTTNRVVRQQLAAPSGRQASYAEELHQIRYREQTIFLAVWRLNPQRGNGTLPLDLAKELNRLTYVALQNFEREERYLRLLKPSDCKMHHAAHDQILQDLDALRISLLDGSQAAALTFDGALAEFLVHCVCNDPWIGSKDSFLGARSGPGKFTHDAL